MGTPFCTIHTFSLTRGLHARHPARRRPRVTNATTAGHGAAQVPAAIRSRSLLERHLQLLRGAGVEEVVLALGFSHQQVEAELDSLRWQPRPEIVLNPDLSWGAC